MNLFLSSTSLLLLLFLMANNNESIIFVQSKKEKHNNNNNNKVKVFGLGPGRSGTDSLRLALKRLGFGPTYHMFEILFEESGISTQKDPELYREAASAILSSQSQQSQGKNKNKNKNKTNPKTLQNLQQIIEPWGSGVDWPLMGFANELYELYPDAKFILTTRPADKWYKSMYNTICLLGYGRPTWYMNINKRLTFAMKPFSRFDPIVKMMDPIIVNAYGDGDDNKNYQYMCDIANREEAMKWYENWNKQMIELIPKKQLLVFETGVHGYEELTRFLFDDGVNDSSSTTVLLEDGETYPNSNSTQEVKMVLMGMRVVAVLILSLSAYFVLYVFRKIAAGLNHKVEEEKTKDD